VECGVRAKEKQAAFVEKVSLLRTFDEVLADNLNKDEFVYVVLV
jgi:hypothetical protein